MQDRFDRILRELSVLRERGVPIFGSGSHDFRMNPCATEDELVAFETARRVRLPEDYRAFLLHVGNGGAGPGYGLWSYTSWNAVTEEHLELDDLDQPCALDPDVPLKALDWATMEDGLGGALAGTLGLSFEGCTYYMLLCVTGRARGRVIHLDVGGQRPFFSEHRAFLDWYEGWLDEALRETELALEDRDIPPGEADLLDLLRRGVRIRAALGALFKLESLAPEAVERAAALLGHEDPRVRTAALDLLARHGPDRFTLALPLLRDPDPEVRVAALGLARLGPPEAVAAELHSMLGDSDPTVLFRALQAVPPESITMSVVLPMVLSPNAAIRGEGAWWFGCLAREAGDDALPELLPIVERMLEDTRDGVAAIALRLLRELKAPHLVERIRPAAMGGEHSDLISDALDALAFQDPEGAVPVLEKHLSSKRTYLRDKAAKMLGVVFYGPEPRPDEDFDDARRGDESYLLDLLAGSAHVEKALDHLCWLPEVGAETVERVVELLEHQTPGVRAMALEVLAAHGRDRHALARPHLHDPHFWVMSSAVKLLSAGPREAWEGDILGMLIDPDATTAMVALEALAGEPSGLAGTVGLLDHPDSGVRDEVRHHLRRGVSGSTPAALAEIAPPLEAALRPYVDSQDAEVRALAAWVLEQLRALQAQ